MNQEQQLKLQAFFDGELSEAEACEVANWIGRDSEASALRTELKNTRQALNGLEEGIKLPETREFYWSKIQREINRLAGQEAVRPALSPFARLLRFAIPVGSFAALVIAGLIAVKNFGSSASAATPALETAMADPGAFTYRDEREGVTLVWLSYGENRLANGNGAATIQ